MHKVKGLPELMSHTMIDIRSHAIGAWPFECCGLIIDGQFIAKKNKHPDPLNGFLIDSNEWSDDIQAVIHSHPDTEHAVPSKADLQFAQSCGVPFGIIPTRSQWAGELVWAGDYTLREELIGRKFLHGVFDCYSLLRAYYWQMCDVYMRDYPRDPEWWVKNKDDANLYLENFQKEGFEQVHDGLREHDILLIKIIPGTKGPHHAGIVMKNSLLLHHWGSQLSCKTPLGNWLKHATHRLRHEKYK